MGVQKNRQDLVENRLHRGGQTFGGKRPDFRVIRTWSNLHPNLPGAKVRHNFQFLAYFMTTEHLSV
jgi:hypothetical protein